MKELDNNRIEELLPRYCLTYSVSNSKFKKAKKLYARAKAIVVKGGETYQGKWSKPKQVKIKK